MKMEIDFSEFIELANRLEETSKLEDFYMSATKAIAELLRECLVKHTPYDTGHLKVAWNSEENCNVEVKKHKYGYSVTLYNRASNNKSKKWPDFKYGLAVNDGHKTPGGGGWVQGKFFVENAVIETAESFLLEETIMRELRKWMEACLNG